MPIPGQMPVTPDQTLADPLTQAPVPGEPSVAIQPTDTAEKPQRPQIDPKILDEIDNADLSTYIMELLKKDIRDRENHGWNYRQKYSIYAYEGYKKEIEGPWKNSSNYAVRMTSTLVDTAHANVIEGIFSDEERVVKVRGVGQEDVRPAGNLSSILNWQVLNDIEGAYDTLDQTMMSAFKTGNGVIKVIQGYKGVQKSKVIWGRVPIENFFIRLNARGAQPAQTDHVFEIIPLDEISWKKRIHLRNSRGELIYKGMKDVMKGSSVTMSTSSQEITQAKDVTSGTSLSEMFSRDMRYIIECHLTYLHQPKDKPDEPPVELEMIVTIASNGGQVLRKALNEDFDESTGEYVRPYATKFIPYPKDDRFPGDSLPWLIKQSQEELDHAHNQNSDAADELIKPPKFYDPGSGFEPENLLLSPSMWIPVPDPSRNVFIPTLNFNPILERSFERYWEYAQRQTGLTELFQGRQQDSSRTLGEAQLRTNKTETRFKSIYKRLEKGFAELMWLTYFYDSKYMPNTVKVKVLGTSDYQSVKEMFPEGVKGRYDFGFASPLAIERIKQDEDAKVFYSVAITNPTCMNSEANQWGLLQILSEAHGIRNFEAVIHKPAAANVLSPQAAIQRVMSGEYDIMPDPGVDATDYKLRIQMFMKSDAFTRANPKEQAAVQLLLRRIIQIDFGQKKAMQDAIVLQEGAKLEAMIGVGGGQAGLPGDRHPVPVVQGNGSTPIPAGVGGA